MTIANDLRQRDEERFREILKLHGSKSFGRMWKPTTPLEIKVEMEQLRMRLRPVAVNHVVEPRASARDFALRAHGSQMYGDRPYSFHLDQVAELARPFGRFEEDLAYLHDLGEDTDETLASIGAVFSRNHAICVGLLSDPPGATRKERKAKAYERFAAATGIELKGLLVKVCDRLANVRACVADGNSRQWLVYQGENAAFKASAFRQGMCDALWDELDGLLSDGVHERMTEEGVEIARAPGQAG